MEVAEAPMSFFQSIETGNVYPTSKAVDTSYEDPSNQLLGNSVPEPGVNPKCVGVSVLYLYLLYSRPILRQVISLLFTTPYVTITNRGVIIRDKCWVITIWNFKSNWKDVLVYL